MYKYLILLCLIATPALGQIGREIEKIEVRGNEKTRVEIIRQVLPLKVGDTLREGDIDRCRVVLERLLLFRTAYVNVKPGAGKRQSHSRGLCAGKAFWRPGHES